MEDNVMAIVMAAGKGTRMKSKKSKLVQKIYGKEIVKRAVENAQKAGSTRHCGSSRIYERRSNGSFRK